MGESHDSVIAKFLFIEMVGTSALTWVVAMSTYQGWRTIGVIFYGIVYFLLLRGLSVFHLRYKKSQGGDDQDVVSLTPRFNPALTLSHFFKTGFSYNGHVSKAVALVLAIASSNAVGAMIGGAALMKIFEKPGGTALDDVFAYGTTYREHNYTSIFPEVTNGPSNATFIKAAMGSTQLLARAVTYESLDHLYTGGAWVEFVGLCVLTYAFTVDDKKGTDAVDLDRPSSSLGKPAAVGTASALIGYIFADYTAGICNPAIIWGIFMHHDISSFWPHLVSSGVALLYLMVILLLGMRFMTKEVVADSSGNVTFLCWAYDNTFLQFGGTFLLVILALHSVGDMGVTAPLRPERWCTVGPIFYGLATASLVWVARHTGKNHEYFNPLANVSVRFLALLGYGDGDGKKSKREAEIKKFVFVVIRDALSVFTAVVYYYYVSPMRDSNPHTSHFVAVGFASYNTKHFQASISKQGASESDAFKASIEGGISWAYLIAPEIIGTAMLVVVTTGSVFQDELRRKSNAFLFGVVSALNVYLFGNLTTGTCNAWISLFSLQIDGNFSEFWSDRVGLVHVAGVLTLILFVTMLLFDDMFNERGEGMRGDRLDKKLTRSLWTATYSNDSLEGYAKVELSDEAATAFVSGDSGNDTPSHSWEM